MRKPKTYKTTYEEIQNKRLERFYVIVHVVKITIPVKKDNEIYNTDIIVIYGYNLLGNKTVIGIYEEDKEDTRYWLEQIEQIRSRNLQTIKFVSAEPNKKLEQALKLVYNDVEIIPSADRIIQKIVGYAPNRWRDETGRELLRMFLADDLKGFEEVVHELKEKYAENRIVTIMLDKYKPEIESFYKYNKIFRHLFCSYYTIRVMLYTFLSAVRQKDDYYEDVKQIVNETLGEYLSRFEATRSYQKKDWIQIQNEIYTKFADEIEELL